MRSDLRAAPITPGHPDYERVRHTYGAAGAPALVIVAETPEDVSDTVRLAADRDLPLAVRSGGHGPSTNDGGIVLDLGRLRAVDVGSGVVRVEAGARWAEVARRLDRHDLALTSGDTGDVGVGGVATVGGVGLFARRQGLTIDRVRAAEVVLADGTLVRADEHRHADLLWAVRGAGGSIGVVIAFEFEADPIEHVTAAELVYDASDLPGLLRRWAALVEDSPRDVSSFLYVQPGPVARALVVDASAGRAAVERFAGVAPVVAQRVAVVRYHTLLESSRSPHRADAAGLIARGGLLDHVTAESAGAMADLLTSGAAFVLQLRSVGGQVNDVAPEATAYAHRSQHFSVVVAAPRPHAQRLDAIGEYTTGAYLNLESERDASVLRRAFPPPTLARLHDLKRRYDPTGRFDHNLPLPGVNP